MCELNKDDSKKLDGTFGNVENTEDITDSNSVSKNPNKWFFHTPWNYDELYKNATEIFSALGFNVAKSTKGLNLIGYNGESGQEDVFLEAVAPYVKDGSYINWIGEDGELYRHEFDGEKMEFKKGTVTWDIAPSH